MRKLLLYIVILVPLLLLGIGIYKLLKHKNHGFQPYKVSINWAFDPRWEVSEKIPLDQVFSKRFIFLSQGLQSYAFVSEDGQYVLKFFRTRLLNHHAWARYLPSCIFKAFQRNKFYRPINKRERIFTAYKQGFEQLQEDTALLYLHLNRTHHLQKRLHLENVDVDLDRSAFVIQKKAVLFYDKILSLIEQGELDQVKQAISQCLDYISRRCRLGFVDTDPVIASNYGFVGDRVVQFDVGQITVNCNPSFSVEREVERCREVILNGILDRAPTFDLNLIAQ